METLEKHFRALAGPSFTKRGAAMGELLQRWPLIVGETIAGLCEPERIRWPKGASSQTSGGILTVRCAPGRGMELQYDTALILERINGFFGHQAVAEIRILQGQRPMGQTAPQKNVADRHVSSDMLEQKLERIGDEKLKEALKRLGQGALSQAANSPQPK